MALPNDTQLLSTLSRQGTHLGSSLTIDQQAATLTLRVDIAPAHLSANKPVKFILEWFDTTSGTWKHKVSATGHGPWDDGTPSLSVGAEDLRGKLVRGVLDVAQNLQIGLWLLQE